MSSIPNPKPASLADVAKLHTAKRQATTAFTAADVAYDEALRKFESAVLNKDVARKTLAWATTAYEAAKAEAGE